MICFTTRRLLPVATLFVGLLFAARLYAAETPYPTIVPSLPDIILYGRIGIVPLSPFAEQLGITVTLNGAGAATATLGAHTVVFRANSKMALCDGVETPLPMATYTTKSELLYVPVDTLISGLGCSMVSDTQRGMATITVPNRTKPLQVPLAAPGVDRRVGVDARYALYAMNLDGSNVRRLTYDNGSEFMPTFFPNSNYFLYTRNGTIMQRAAEDPTKEMALPRPIDAKNMSVYYSCGLSADKKLLAFTSWYNNKSRHVYTLRSGEGKPQEISSDGCMPNLSPDGTTIAYLRRIENGDPNQSVGSPLSLMAADGSNIRIIDENAGINFQPFFSPDGSLLAYQRVFKDAQQHIRKMIVCYQVTGENAGKIYTIPTETLKGDEWGANFSPDSQWIAISNTVTGLQVMKPDRTQATKLQSNGTNSPRFSPDGTRLIYRIGNDVRMVSRDGQKNELVLQGPVFTDLAFTPDGKQILFIAIPFAPSKLTKP